MSPPRSLAALAALAVVLSMVVPVAVGPALGASDGEDAVTLDTDIPINSDAKVQTYEQDGKVSAGVNAPQMEIEIGEERDDVGLGYTLDPLDGSTRNDFIRITHSEDMTRTVRVPISSGYWKPFPREELESMDGNHTARFDAVKVDGKTYTLITVTFSGKDSAVFPVPEDAVAVYSAAERTEKQTNSTFGIDLGLTPSPWSRVPDGVFGNETAVRIEGDTEKMMIQYNAGTSENPEWLMVPDEPTRNVPVYWMTKEGVDGAVYVVSKTSEPPAVRYKTQSSYGDKVSVWWREASSIPGRIADGFGWELPDVSLPFSVSTPVEVAS